MVGVNMDVKDVRRCVTRGGLINLQEGRGLRRPGPSTREGPGSAAAELEAHELTTQSRTIRWPRMCEDDQWVAERCLRAIEGTRVDHS